MSKFFDTFDISLLKGYYFLCPHSYDDDIIQILFLHSDPVTLIPIIKKVV